ncbi:MAG: DEAD/DEAH box helicase family protein [Gammaproteobacteria bacterium]|nr:DEAD/DEAH box helicase family protein [Gammaproteobacteria bacterium]MCY4341520.1 DEAD/DEAH box helicase family protein [Gammaproteobacteria bacterium]
MNSLDRLLDSYRAQAMTERDKGAAFEKLVAAWLVADPLQSKRFAKAELGTEWARRHDRRRTDIGIDLVCTRHDGGLAAVQCKLFAPQRSIQKTDIDSFISTSGTNEFAERLIVETTEPPWSDNAQAMVDDQAIPTTVIGLQDLRESRVDWSRFAATGDITRPEPRTLRADQVEALDCVKAGLKAANRGKLIMACGTGKTLTSLRIAEELAGEGGRVLLLVPSLALMAQTVPEWCADTLLSMTAFAVCSDTQVGRKRRSAFDVAELEATDLAFPATTKADKLAAALAASDTRSMRVVFATYQSISVIAEAQARHGLPQFDLIVCDEAHRTTGVTFAGEDQSNFVKVHYNSVIRGRKRLYMTATPRIYGENARSKAREADAVLASMDDPELYGEVLFHHGFARAVDSDILTDYRVIVLAMDENEVSTAVQKRLADDDSELLLDDATRIVGCWKALSKVGLEGLGADRPGSMKRALAFCRNIKSSKMVRDEFREVIADYRDGADDDALADFDCEVRHVDGTYKARARKERLDWLKEDAGPDACRILSNARCLTEGVDVPALDAIVFLHPRNSQIDVVQAVGRVMRRAEGKHMGYVILPVGVPPDVPANVALNDNRKYRVVWQILNALRAHDERLDAVINQGGLGQDVSDRIAVIDGRSAADSAELRAVTATVEDLPSRSKPSGIGIGEGDTAYDQDRGEERGPAQLVIDEFSRAVMAKIVEKCGTRDYWEDWAKDVAEIAERHITRIRSLVAQDGSDAQTFFQDFLKEVRDDLNESVSDADAIEMLAQHLITRPVFNAVFQGHPFVERNPVSQAMTEVLSVIDEAQINREAKSLEGFYASVRRRASGITNPQARQALIVELYDKFFRNAFPLTTQKLGIVYTPVEIVDFIIHSVNDVLRNEFGQTLGSEGVHILDPFVGTGTFITRLLQSGLITPDDLERKYRKEIHCNELVLLAYYIAAINIETVFHTIAGREGYLPFEGICLTDTFALHEGEDELSFYMKDNTDRRERQKATDVRVIIGNPPYSAGQKNQNDNAKNVAYPGLDEQIRSTYAKKSRTANVQNLYDSYIRAIRWGTNRIGEAGVMAYVSGSAWIERAFADGMRKCIAEDFSTVHVFHLRGDIRKNMLSGGRAGEGENVFGQGSMTGIAISVFVKNPNTEEKGRILFHDIGNELDRKQKLYKIKHFSSIGGINRAKTWRSIEPDEHGDWLDQRDPGFKDFPAIGDKKDKTGRVLFKNYSLGIATGSDAWCINPSPTQLANSIRSTIDFFNEELSRWRKHKLDLNLGAGTLPDIDEFVNNDTHRISWTHNLKQDIHIGKGLHENDGVYVPCMYRPFTKQRQFLSRRMNQRVYQMPRIFPDAGSPNRVIAISGKGARAGFSALMMNTLPSLDSIEKGQCFPIWLYDEASSDASPGMLSDPGSQPAAKRRNAITDYALELFTQAYPAETISREDIFHYIYGLLHSEDYRQRFRANLAKELPRIPCVKPVEDYRAFRDAGKQLGELHVGYESVDPWPAMIDTGGNELPANPEAAFRVTKMRHPGTGRNKDRSTVIYNPHITIRNIPEDAWEYVVNGKPALQWVMERQRVKTDKASGIVSDANRYAIETAGDPRYPLDLLLRVTTVSLETTKIARALPELA